MEELKQTITERRRQTRNKMYRFIYDAESPVSKQQIANTLGYSLPTVHQNIAELLDAGLILPGKVLKSTGGRPAVGYTVNSELKYAIGISVSLNHLRLLASDLKQHEVAYKRIERQYSGGQEVGREVAEELNLFLKEHDLAPDKILGVGLTFPGVIDRTKDTIVLSPTLNSKDISLSAIREAVPYRLFIENDSTSGGAAEWLSLPMKERIDDFVYLFLENGIGGAVFIDGKPFEGSNSRSGEFGHMTTEPGGRLCNCGKKGCLEAYCSALRFTRDLGNISAEDFFAGIEAGNEQYRKIWEDVLDHLAIGINNLRMAFDCDIILGGFVSQYLEPYMDALKSRIASRNTFGERTDYIKLGKYPTKAGMMGVAWHFTDEFISGI
jgi:predicted NBD/HSP70 family sugar kinase